MQKASESKKTKKASSFIGRHVDMLTRGKLKNAFLISSLICCFFYVLMEFSTWLDIDFVDSLNLSPDADSVAIPLFNGIFIAVLVASIAIGTYFLLGKTKNKQKIDHRILFRNIEKLHLSIFRYMVLAACLVILCASFIPFPHVTILADIFYVLSMCVGVLSIMLFFTIIIGSSVTKKEPKTKKPIKSKDAFISIGKCLGIMALAIIYVRFFIPIIAIVIFQIFFILLDPFL